MYLKEAFRYQNYLKDQISTALGLLASGQYATKTVQEHLRNKANPDAENETMDLTSERILPYSADQLVSFLQHLIYEKEVLTGAISNSKKWYPVDVDLEIANNQVRHRVATILSNMCRMKSSERTTTGFAYKFNADGNQVQYAYDIKEITTIDFDRNSVKSILKALTKQADEASEAIDKAMVDMFVNYEPSYSTNDSFEDALEQFISMSGAETCENEA